jgi:hypothetical protein
VTTQHHTNTQIPRQDGRTVRCHRHHVWMAACDDCRTAHAPLLTRAEDRTTAGR